jgi:CheY-like chemotaxis protein
VLVIDGDPDDLETVGRALSGRGYAITLSSTLLESDTVAALAPDLIIVDPFLPRSGVRRERTHQETACLDVPVICHTARPEYLRAMATSGVRTHAKSSPLAGLVALVDSLLGSLPASPVVISVPGAVHERGEGTS